MRIIELLSHFLGKRKKPLETAQGNRLLQFFQDAKLGEAEREVFEQLIDGDCWKSVELLVAKLKESRGGFVAMIKQAPCENHLLWTLRSWRGALTHSVLRNPFLILIIKRMALGTVRAGQQSLQGRAHPL